MYRISVYCYSNIFRKPSSSKNWQFLNTNYNRYCLKRKVQTGTALASDPRKINPLGWFLLVVPATTFGLGCWQVKRKAWKENLIKELERSLNTDPVNLPDNLDDLVDMEYCPVMLEGQFLHEKELYLGPRSYIRADGAESRGGLFSARDGSMGYLVITPFKLLGREEIILVNRGWVPRNLLNPDSRRQGQIEGYIKLIGVVRNGESRPQFTPDHKGNIYLFRDLKKMCDETGAYPVLVDAKYESTVPGGPAGGQTRVTLRNEHLSYIVTWFSLSFATAFMWYQKILRRKAF